MHGVVFDIFTAWRRMARSEVRGAGAAKKFSDAKSRWLARFGAALEGSLDFFGKFVHILFHVNPTLGDASRSVMDAGPAMTRAA